MKKKVLIAMFIIAALGCIIGSSVFAADGVTNGYIVKFKSPPVMMASENGAMLPVVPDENIYKVTDELAANISNSGNIEYIEPDGKVYIPDDENFCAAENRAVSMAEVFETPNDTYFSRQWNMPIIKTEALWKNGLDAAGVRIGVIDSGSPALHPDVKQNIVGGEDFTGTGMKFDIIGHSTFICGIIGADTNNSLGTAGMLTNCEIVPLRIFHNSKTGDVSKTVAAIYSAINVYDCDVINLSLTTPNVFNSMRDAIAAAVNKGVIVVAAAGNSSGSGVQYPAGFDGVIGVAAVGKTKKRQVHSQYNESVDISAPGDMVYSTYMSKDSDDVYSYIYDYGSGTSYASPHIAAAAAVAKKIRPEITSDEFLEVLAKTSEHLGDEGKNIYYGYGLINIENMVYALQHPNETPPPSTPTAVPQPTSLPTYTPAGEPSEAPMPTSLPTVMPQPTYGPDEPQIVGFTHTGENATEVTFRNIYAGVVIAAKYEDSGVLSGFEVKTLTPAEAESGVVVIGGIEADTVFVWNSLDQMMPICMYRG